MAIKLKIIDNGDKLKVERQKIIGEIIKSKDRQRVEELQKDLTEINKKIRCQNE